MSQKVIHNDLEVNNLHEHDHNHLRNHKRVMYSHPDCVAKANQLRLSKMSDSTIISQALPIH